jgi:peptide-methionine (S)-S-oxide reductase
MYTLMNLKRLLLLCVFALLFACSGSQQIEEKDGFAVLPLLGKGEAVATYAGGCFWAMQEALLQLKGVRMVISGYAGGTKVNPTYEEVLSGQTGHAESVQVYYNPDLISFRELARAFFYAHDPTQLNRQGPDLGSDYRSIAFYRNKEEYEVIAELITELHQKKIYKKEVVTELNAFEVFYPAEIEHQDYYQKNIWDPYIRKVSKPKVVKVRHAFPHLIKSEYAD